MRNRLVWLGLAVVVVAAAGIGWVVLRSGGAQASPSETAEVFLESWAADDLDAMAALVHDGPSGFEDEFTDAVSELHIVEASFAPGEPVESGDRAEVPLTARLQLGGLGEWEYDGSLDLVSSDGKWWIEWSPSVVHPELPDGARLRRTRTWPERAPILGAGDAPLVGPREVVVVGVEPQRIDDREALLAALEEHVGADPERVAADLDRPGVQPDWFVPVITLRPEEYEAVRPDLYPVPGTVFRRQDARAAPSDDFAAHVLGRTGEITAEQLEQWGEPYRIGDVVGRSGLERVHEERLAGRPSGEVQILSDDARRPITLATIDGVEPEPLVLTIDPAVQGAAEQAVNGVEQPLGLVALDASTGEIRAVVSRPLDEGFNRALAGRYPPGSTFKIVTAAAALDAGAVSPEAPVECPAEAVVGGKPFGNVDDQDLGSVPFREAFARSCNTVFAPLAADLGADVLAETAARFGFGAEYDVGLPAAGGRFPDPGDAAELAAAGIGQGRVEASPLHMATVAGAVAGGSWRPPSLATVTLDPAAAAAAPDALAPEAVADLRALMRAVVESGTGTAAAVEGRTVAGKTGSAEFGEGQPPPTHAWFVGYSDGLAFAVLVEGGGSGGAVAAPVAAAFVSGL